MTRRKIIIALTILVFVFGLAVCVKTYAGNATGWLWGGSEETQDTVINGNETGVGRINANCGSIVDSNLSDSINTGDVALKICDGGTYDLQSCNGPEAMSCGVGINCTDACTVLNGRGIGTNYKLNVPSTAGNVTGFVWSKNIGWIDFDPQDHCIVDLNGILDPQTSPNYEADTCATNEATCNIVNSNGGVNVDASGNLSGCARIVGIAQESVTGNSGGWQGWLRMNNTNGVHVDTATGDFSGYAWNGEVAGSPQQGLGWVRFTGVNVPPVPHVSLSVSSGAVGNSIVLTPGTSLSKDITLTWSIDNIATSNPSSCTASCVARNCDGWDNPTTNKTVPTISTPSQSQAGIHVQSAVVTYGITCTGPGGDSNLATVSVSSICNSHVCQAQACTEVPITTDTYVCTDDCTLGRDDQCQTGDGNWKEINP